MTSRQLGFGPIGIIIATAVIGLITFFGWYVIQRHNIGTTSKTVQASESKKSTKPQSDTGTSDHAFVLPSGWTWYENKEFGFKFAYPEKWGQLKLSEAGSLLLSMYTDEYTDSNSQVQGRVNLTVRDKSSFELSPEKYSVTLKPQDNATKWLITNVNPSVADKYNVGDIYNLQGKRAVDGGIIYFLTHSDEGCTMNRYILLLKDGYGELSTPALCSQTTTTSTNKTAFDEVSDDITSSLTIF